MRVRRPQWPVRWAGAALAIALAASHTAAGDEAKHDCRQGCVEAERSCKADCPSRDSGDLQASAIYVDCDAGCHSTYADCVAACDQD